MRLFDLIEDFEELGDAILEGDFEETLDEIKDICEELGFIEDDD